MRLMLLELFDMGLQGFQTGVRMLILLLRHLGKPLHLLVRFVSPIKILSSI